MPLGQSLHRTDKVGLPIVDAMVDAKRLGVRASRRSAPSPAPSRWHAWPAEPPPCRPRSPQHGSARSRPRAGGRTRTSNHPPFRRRSQERATRSTEQETSTHRRGRTRRCGRGSRARRRPRRGAQSRRCRRASPARRRRSRKMARTATRPARARKTAGRCARRQRTGAARRRKRYGRLRGDGNAARFGPLALWQRHSSTPFTRRAEIWSRSKCWALVSVKRRR